MNSLKLFGIGAYTSLFVFLGFLSCQRSGGEDQLETVVNKVVETHGAQHFASKKVAFNFRNKRYSLERLSDRYIYTRSYEDSLGLVEDQLVNSSEFTRSINGEGIELTQEWQERFGNSVNSVLYFVEILYRLNDGATFKSYEGTTTIRGEKYHTIKVTFKEENGGEDFEDQYLYWIHAEDFTLDFLAYNYKTDGGGVRFREAYDREKIGGIVFQNYVNYKPASKATPLEELPVLFDQGKLKELSRIVNENIEVI